MPYSPIARGVLTGKYKVNQKAEPGSRAGRQDKRMLESEWRPESLMIAEKLKAHAESARHDAGRLGDRPGCSTTAPSPSTIAGPRTFEQWTSYFGALDYKWTAEDEALANSLVTPGHASTPGFNDPAYPGRGPVPGGGLRSSRRSSPGSSLPQAPERSERWIPGTRRRDDHAA